MMNHGLYVKSGEGGYQPTRSAQARFDMKLTKTLLTYEFPMASSKYPKQDLSAGDLI